MSSLKSLNISGVNFEKNSIPYGAFQGMVLNNLVLPKNIIKIEERVFKDATIPPLDFSQFTDLEYIGSDAFYNVKGLDIIDLGKNTKLKTIEGFAFGLGVKHVILPKHFKDLSNYLFYDFIGTIEFPETLNSIGRQCFQNTKFKEITIPTGVTSILKQTFSHNTELQKVNFPTTLKRIEDLAFYNCPQITKVDFLPEGLTFIGERAFDECPNIKKLIIPSTVDSIENRAFWKSANLSLVISLNPIPPVASLPANTVNYGIIIVPKGSLGLYKTAENWKYCGTIYEFGYLSYTTKNFGSGSGVAGTLAEMLGENIDKITDITISGSIKPSDFSTLRNMTSLTYIDLSEAVLDNNTLSKNAFSGKRLDKIILPNTLEIIDQYAFQNTDISSIDFSNCTNLHTIKSGAFGGMIGEGALDFSKNSKLTNYEQVLFGDIIKTIIFPESLKEISGYIFHGFRGKVIFPEGLISMDASFMASRIAELTFPKNLKSITGSFSYCDNLSKIVSLNPTPPQLGENVFKYFDKNKCTLYVPEGSVDAYKAADQWKDFFIIGGIQPETKLTLHYTEDGGRTILGTYEGVRVGEYYWMNSPFRDEVCKNTADQDRFIKEWELNKATSKAQIDLWHQRAWMFEGASSWDKTSYFDEIGGNSETEKIRNIHQYYGTYHARSHIDWMWANGPYLDINNQNAGRVRLMEGNNITFNGWDLPDPSAIRQLVAMCGNATRDEVRIYLSPQYNDGGNNPPMVIPGKKYMSWFNKTIHSDVIDFAHNNGMVEESYINKYGFNAYPSGVRLQNADIITLTNHDTGKDVNYNGIMGDFEGFNQQFTMVAHGDNHFVLHDYPQIKAIKSWRWIPIRWCRPLTDEELGYKLYINHPGFVDTRSSLLALKDRINRGEKIIIEKKKLSEAPSSGFVELTRGYLRGFYVQFILDKQTPEKTIEELVNIALHNPYIWGNNTKSTTDPEQQIRSSLSPFRLDNSNISVYPNPVTDVLNINGEDIEKIEVYDINGRLVIQSNSISISTNNLNAGIYIVKIITANGISSHKVVKK